MSFSIVNNVAAANAQANLATTNIGLNKALNRLSSGLRINNSGDDAAGLAVANAYRSNIAVLNQGIRNAGDGLSTLQIEDGALDNISKLLDRLATLATQSASSSSSVDRSALDSEFQDVLGEIDREASVAGLDATQGFSVFVSNDSTNGTIGGSVNAADTAGLSLTGLAVDTAPNAAAAVAALAGAVTALGARSGAGRNHREPSAVRHQPVAVAGGEQHGGGKPDSRCEHRGRVVEPDEVHGPHAERCRVAGAGQRDNGGGSDAAPVNRFRRVSHIVGVWSRARPDTDSFCALLPSGEGGSDLA